MSRPIPLSDLRSPVSTRFLTEEPPLSPRDVDDVFPNSTSFDEPPDHIKSPQKRAAFDLLERPTSSPSAFLVHFASTSLIVFSAVVTILETVPSFHTTSPRVWFGLETTLVLLFTVEYSARLFAWSSSWQTLAKWMFSFYGLVDMLAILPYYIEVILHQDTTVLFRFSILRMFRLLRVFRPFRHNSTILFYFAERGAWDDTLEIFVNSDGDPSQFPSIPAAAWFVLVTITTVGYGEITPRSFLGRLVTVPLLVFGLLLIALPSFVLGREFSVTDFQLSGAHVAPFTTLEARSEPHRDLTNRKLAQNQAELSRQISELRMAVEQQGEVVKELLAILGRKEKAEQRESFVTGT
ncbi:hypothetical protein ID866_1103 [Astraeus odoratus]|nr:hypothetical protein ID866_1103 [Astraeus odoratus]